ncbi:hypothetical protein SUGI_1023500 [Cryptomeria japonica]|nr:hypothetical protein SUGI_1023500 [Cryptomeria japonica]
MQLAGVNTNSTMFASILPASAKAQNWSYGTGYGHPLIHYWKGISFDRSATYRIYALLHDKVRNRALTGEGCGRGRGIARFIPFLGAYRCKSNHHYWTPAKSVHKLLQEIYYRNPWKVLVSFKLLNKTNGVSLCPSHLP